MRSGLLSRGNNHGLKCNIYCRMSVPRSFSTRSSNKFYCKLNFPPSLLFPPLFAPFTPRLFCSLAVCEFFWHTEMGEMMFHPTSHTHIACDCECVYVTIRRAIPSSLSHTFIGRSLSPLPKGEKWAEEGRGEAPLALEINDGVWRRKVEEFFPPTDRPTSAAVLSLFRSPPPRHFNFFLPPAAGRWK